ncbi:SGNH/GDSL hydrolase family protein [Pseudomonas sp.]|uniref:SGNH/GDSL hydrolase family protein n=1 Tax=Pseudomonas sp. TaxID=306 RepID=UPI003FD7B8CC
MKNVEIKRVSREADLPSAKHNKGAMIQVIASGGNLFVSDGEFWKAKTGEQSSSVTPSATRSLSRWRKKLETDAANAKLVLIGDSTTDYTTSSSGMTDWLRNAGTQIGQPLSGMTADANHIYAQGYNGITLLLWLADQNKLATLAATNADLVIASFGLNDVRLGACTLDQMKARIEQLVVGITASMPNTDILLRIPNTMLTTNTGNLNYVQDGQGTINPAGAAQALSSLLRDAYKSMLGRWPHVDVIDTQAEVFGTVARSTHPLMADQLHPTPVMSTIGSTPKGGGYVAIAEALAKRVGVNNSAFSVDNNQYRANSGNSKFVIVAGGNGYFDVSNLDGVNEMPASQFPLTIADFVFIAGFASPVALTSAAITRPFGGTNIRVSLAGDWTAAVGKRAVLAATHALATTQDRQIVSVDLPSIAAGAIISITAAVTGSRTGALHDATAAVATPPAAFITAGLVLLNCYPSANDTVTLVVQNPTAAAVDLAAANFAFWVVR